MNVGSLLGSIYFIDITCTLILLKKLPTILSRIEREVKLDNPFCLLPVPWLVLWVNQRRLCCPRPRDIVDSASDREGVDLQRQGSSETFGLWETEHRAESRDTAEIRENLSDGHHLKSSALTWIKNNLIFGVLAIVAIERDPARTSEWWAESPEVLGSFRSVF